MLVSTNLFYTRVNKQLGTLAERTQTLQTQISTGQRLSTASDDPGAYRRLQKLDRAAADDSAWRNNITIATSVLGQADSTLSDITGLLQNAQELAVQGNNGTLSPADRKLVGQQLRGVIDDIVNLANVRDGRGSPLFGGATGDVALVRDASGNVSFGGTGDPASIPIADGIEVRPSESAEKIFGGLPKAGGGTTDIFTELANLASAFESGTNYNGVAKDTLTSLTNALDQANAVRGSIGARGARLELETTRLDNTNVLRTEDREKTGGTDLQSTLVELQKTSTILQATQASLAKLSQLSLFDFIR